MARLHRAPPVFRVADESLDGPPELRAISFRPLADAAEPPEPADPALAPPIALADGEDPAALALAFAASPRADRARGPDDRTRRTPGWTAAAIALAAVAFLAGRVTGAPHAARTPSPVLGPATSPHHAHRAARPAHRTRRGAHVHRTRRRPAARTAVNAPSDSAVQAVARPRVAAIALAPSGPRVSRLGASVAADEFGFEGDR